jgi:putative oxidoreductase
MLGSSKYLAALGRIMIAAIFLVSGVQKVLGPEQTQQYIASAGLPQPVVLYWATVATEILGGLALVFGVQARLAALLLAGFTVLAAVIFHRDFANQVQFLMFMKDIAIAGGLLQIVAFGSGGLGLGRR